jgi:hypothetical protein
MFTPGASVCDSTPRIGGVPILGNDPRKREKHPDLFQKRKLVSEIVREALYPDFIPK